MGQCRFIIQNYALGATYTRPSWHTAPINETGWDALLDPSPSNRLRAQTNNWASSGLYRYRFIADIGAQLELDTVAFVSTNITTGSLVQAWFYVNDPTVGAPAAVATLSSGTLGDRTRSINQVVLSSPAKIMARYVSFFIDVSNPYLEFGTLLIGNSWQPTYNFDLQYQVGRMDLGSREVNPSTGAAFDFIGARPRIWTISLGALSVSEVETYIDDIDRLLGSTGDILFIPDHEDSYNTMSLRSVYGACRLSGEGLAGQFFPNLYKRPMRIQERL